AQVTVPAMLAVAVLLGTASGVVLGHTGSTAPADQIATIAGVIGAVAGVAGLLPPLLLAAVYGLQGSYGIALTLLAGGALAAAAATAATRSSPGYAGTCRGTPSSRSPPRPHRIRTRPRRSRKCSTSARWPSRSSHCQPGPERDPVGRPDRRRPGPAPVTRPGG